MATEIFPSLRLLRADDSGDGVPFTYLIKRPEGHILLPTKAVLPPGTDLGPVYLALHGDRHHANPDLVALAQTRGATACASAAEATPLRKAGVTIDRELDMKRQWLTDDIEAVPTPGHTAGALSYLWHAGGRKYLFVGDTLAPVGDRWEFWVSKPNYAKMRATVATIAALEADVILSNSFASAPAPWREPSSRQRREMAEDLIARLSA